MNRFSRIKTINPGILAIHYEAETEVSTKIVQLGSLRADTTAELNPEGTPFLFPSRYCQSDIMRQQANDLFGNIQGSYAIAAAVSE